WNVPLIVISVLAFVMSGWLFTSLREQRRVTTRSQAVLVAALKDRSQPQPIRVFAAQSLAGMGRDARDALPSLMEALGDPDALVRVEAAKAIGHVGSGDPYLLAELQKIRKETEVSNLGQALDETMQQLKSQPHGGSLLLYIFLGLLTMG